MNVAMRSGVRQAGTRQMFKRVWFAVAIVAMLLPLSSLAATAAHWAPPRTVFVPESGQTVDGLFLDLWRDHRGLFGDPITPEMAADRGWSDDSGQGSVVQYYENAALLYAPDAAPESQVQLLPLGRTLLEDAIEAGPSQALTNASQRRVCGNRVDCVSDPAWGHTLQGAFRAYWADEDPTLLGAVLTEAFRAPDGTIVQIFENAVLRLDESGVARPLPLGRQMADRSKLDTKRLPQPADVPAYDEALFIPDPEPVLTGEAAMNRWSVGTLGPGPQQGAWKEIVVSLSQQAMWAYEGGELVRSSYVSTGTAEVVETETPIGYWSILTKYDIQDMQGTINGESYFVPDVPDIMYFDNLGNALHGTYWHSNFGTPMSHGCVNLPLEVAAWMFDWAPIGTAVSVIA